MSTSNTKILFFEIISMAAVYGLGYVVAVFNHLYLAGTPSYSPHIGGALTLGGYGIFWIIWSKYHYDTAWATKEDFQDTESVKVDSELTNWEDE